MENLNIPDNCVNGKSFSLTDKQWSEIKSISDNNLSLLVNADDQKGSVLIFPHDLNEYGDQIGNEKILEVKGNKIVTGNLMGFIGINDLNIRIYSRFDSEETDYFLHYMLGKVLSINLFDWKYNSSLENIFDLLPFLFPFFLKSAMRKGLLRQYISVTHNDSKFKGRLDFKEQIRHNVPFTGNFSYITREYSADNPIIHLIWHTIKTIESKDFGNNIINTDWETRQYVKEIINLVQSFRKRSKSLVLAQNSKSKIHPLFNEYEPLRRLCISILKNEELKYGSDDNKIYGILFDGAWLWEEYLFTFLSDLKLEHPKNKMKEGALYLFKESKKARCFPDFYNQNIVLDAKYKKYNGAQVWDVNSNDLQQLLAYLYLTGAKKGAFLVPAAQNSVYHSAHINSLYAGEMAILPLTISDNKSNYKTFSQEMELSERRLKEEIKSYISR